jgi:hypothetical protein
MGKTLPTIRAAALGAATALALAAAPPASLADYQFIVSGYPAANVSYPSASAGTDIVTATCSSPTTAAPLEARYRTWGESEGTDLRSDEPSGFFIIVR